MKLAPNVDTIINKHFNTRSSSMSLASNVNTMLNNNFDKEGFSNESGAQRGHHAK